MKKREYRCFFEGQQEKMYFDHVSNIIKECNENISVKFKQVGKLKTLEVMSSDVPKLAVFDYDLNKQNFEKNVLTCKKTRILYSNLNFDLWLLLHKEKFTKNVQNNSSYVDAIRKEYCLDGTANIKKKAIIDKILQQITIDDIKNAIKNGNEIMKGKIEKDKIFVGRSFYYYTNPSMSINDFFNDLFKELNI